MFFLFFFPISGRRPEIPALAGGQGPNASVALSLVADRAILDRCL